MFPYDPQPHQGNANALFEAIGRRRLWREAYRQLDNKADAEDAVQDAFMVIFCGDRQGGSWENQRRYADGVLRHKVLDLLRDRWRRRTDEEAGMAPPLDTAMAAWQGDASRLDGLTAPEYGADLARAAAAVRLAVGTLSPRCRQVFVLHVEHGLDAREIGALLNISVNNTWVLWSRTRQQLRMALGGVPAGRVLAASSIDSRPACRTGKRRARL